MFLGKKNPSLNTKIALIEMLKEWCYRLLYTEVFLIKYSDLFLIFIFLVVLNLNSWTDFE